MFTNEGQSFVIYQLFMNWSSFSFIYRWCPFSISLTVLSAVLQEVIVSMIQYSTNAYHSIILLYIGFNINNPYIHHYKNVFVHTFNYYAYDSNAQVLFRFRVLRIQMHMWSVIQLGASLRRVACSFSWRPKNLINIICFFSKHTHTLELYKHCKK